MQRFFHFGKRLKMAGYGKALQADLLAVTDAGLAL